MNTTMNTTNNINFASGLSAGRYNNLRRELIRKDRVYVNKLVVKGDDRALVVQGQDSSPLVEEIPYVLLSTNKRFFKRLLSITCDPSDGTLMTLLVDGGVYVEFKEDGLTPKSAYAKTASGLYMKLVGKTAQPTSDVAHYRILSYSAGDKKIGKFWAYDGSEEERVGLISKATHGASDGMLFDEDDFETTNKALMRFASMNTPAKCIYKDLKVAYLDGEFPSGYKSGNDGMAFTNADTLGLMEGMGLQFRSRPVTSKVFAASVQAPFIELLIKKLRSFGSVYLPKGVAIEEIDMVLDKNGVKLHNMRLNADMTFESDPIELLLLDMPSTGPVKTSLQMWEKVVRAKPSTGFAIVEEYMRAGIVTDLLKRFEKEPSLPKIGETDTMWTRSTVVQDILRMAPKAIKKDKGLAYTVIEQTMDSVQSSIRKMAVEINESVYARIMADVAYMFLGESVIKMGEFYSNKDIEEAVFFKYPSMHNREYYYAKNMKNELPDRVRAIADSEETAEIVLRFFASLHQSVLVLPNSETLRKLQAGMDFDFDGVAMIWDRTLVDALRTNAPVVVDIVNSEEKDLASALEAKGYVAPQKKERSMVPLNESILKKVYLKEVLSDAKGIGPISNLNTTETAILLSLLHYKAREDKAEIQRLMTFAKAMLVEAAQVKEPGKEVYEPMPVSKFEEDGLAITSIPVSEAYEKLLIEKIRRANLNSLRNVLCILTDINSLRRRHQEITIDSSKTGIFLKIDLWVNKTKAKVLVPPTYDLDSENATVKFRRDFVSKNTRVVVDVFSKIQDTLMKEIEEYATAYWTPLYEEAGFSIQDFASFAEMTQTHREEFSALVMAKKVYTNANAVIMREIARAKDDDVKEALGDKLSTTWDILTKIVYSATAEMDADRASKLLMAVNTFNLTTKKFVNSRQRFAMKVAPAMYAEYIVKNSEDAYPMEAERFYGEVVDGVNGTVLDLVNGEYSGTFGYGRIRSDYTGEVVVQEINGKLFAVREAQFPREIPTTRPVLMTSVVGKVEEGDCVIFVKEHTEEYIEHKAYKLTVNDGIVTGSSLIGSINVNNMVEYSDLSKGIVKAYYVGGRDSIDHTVTVDGRTFEFALDCLHVY